jgi:hypothetical protein
MRILPRWVLRKDSFEDEKEPQRKWVDRGPRGKELGEGRD